MVQNQRSSIAPSSSIGWPKKWNIPSWISLEHPSMGHDASGSSTSIGGGHGTIDRMAWDATGVLLAVASDRTIGIYDWDVLRAADLRGRSDRARRCQDSGFRIPPIARFRVPQPVSSLVWNPFEPDELAVGFRASGQTILYNVDRVARWLSGDPSRNHLRPPPPTTHQSIVLQRVTGSVGDILFLDAQNLLIGAGTILFCWKRNPQHQRPRPRPQPQPRPPSQHRQPPNGTTASGSLVWRYQPPSPVTSMAAIGSNLAIVGTNRGHLCLMDWTQRTRATLSFSHEHGPRVLRTWVPHDRLKAARDDTGLRNWMGITRLPAAAAAAIVNANGTTGDTAACCG